MISEFFNEFLYRPISNVLAVLSLWLPGQNFGLAVIVLTIAFKLLLLPLNKTMEEGKNNLAKIQPKIKKIQEEFKDDEKKQLEELKILYKEHNFNPLSSFIPLLIQFPVLIALYRVFLKGFTQKDLYSFVPHAINVDYSFFGANLMTPSLVLAVITVMVYFVQTKISLQNNKNDNNKKNDMAMNFQKQMPYFFSILTFVVLVKVPSAVSLYLIVSSLFTMIQQYTLKKNESK